MSGENFSELRRRLLAGTVGDVLEIGFGTGLNLPHYPAAVHSVTAVDSNPGMSRLAQARVAACPIAVRSETLDGQSLPFAACLFDCVVSTWTLCSIPDPKRALEELHRVLKPGGRFRFVEHGRSPDPAVSRWQDRLTPLQEVLADGCRLNRDIRGLVLAAGFEVLELDTFYMKGVPRIGGYLYFGSATKSS